MVTMFRLVAIVCKPTEADVDKITSPVYISDNNASTWDVVMPGSIIIQVSSVEDITDANSGERVTSMYRCALAVPSSQTKVVSPSPSVSWL